MPEPIIMCGATNCGDTHRTRAYLLQNKIPFKEINIDHNAQAAQFVIFANLGYRSTPTLIIGEGRKKKLFTEPTNSELDQIVADAGYPRTTG